MMICPKCERCFRDGDMIRVSVLGEFLRVDTEGHSIRAYDEEWMEHLSCEPDRWEARLVKFFRRKWRWLKEYI